MMKKVTIKDIARIAGVSRGTVDRVINNRGNVAHEVKQKILKIADELGYEKNFMASALASQKKFTIAIVMPHPSGDLFWAQPREGINRALELVGNYGIIVQYFDFNNFDKSDFVMQMRNAINARPDAILTAPTFTTESIEFLNLAESNKIPFITINTEIVHPDILCYIGQNSFQAGILAGRLFHLRLKVGDEVLAINLGHSLNNAQHYADKVTGLRDYFDENNKEGKSIFYYEFQQFNDQKLLKRFWEDIKVKHHNMKGLFFTNSRAYRLLDVFDEIDYGKYYIVGFDMVAPNIQYLNDKKMDFIINQNPIEQGYLGIMNFINHFVLKKEIKKTQYLPLDIIVKENVEYYITAK